MGRWKYCKLNEVVELNMGQSPKSEFYNARKMGIPLLQGNRTFGFRYPKYDVYTTQTKKLAYPGDIVMSVRAPVGDINIADQKVCIGRGVCSLRMKSGSQDFLYYLLKANIKKLLQKQNGTVFSSVNKKDIENLIIRMPEDIKDQTSIASFLNTIDGKITLNNRINDNLPA